MGTRWSIHVKRYEWNLELVLVNVQLEYVSFIDPVQDYEASIPENGSCWFQFLLLTRLINELVSLSFV